MKVYKNDIHKIGNTVYKNDDGYVCMICDCQTSNIEEILLREILLKFGNYKITSSNDFIWDNGIIDIENITNLPFDLYDKYG